MKVSFDGLHPDDRGMWARIVVVAPEVARRQMLPLAEIRPDSSRQTARLGRCFVNAGIVEILVRFRDPDTGMWMGRLPEAELWQTLAHELAHLDETKHTARFRALEASLLEEIYCVLRGE